MNSAAVAWRCEHPLPVDWSTSKDADGAVEDGCHSAAPALRRLAGGGLVSGCSFGRRSDHEADMVGHLQRSEQHISTWHGCAERVRARQQYETCSESPNIIKSSLPDPPQRAVMLAASAGHAAAASCWRPAGQKQGHHCRRWRPGRGARRGALLRRRSPGLGLPNHTAALSLRGLPSPPPWLHIGGVTFESVYALRHRRSRLWDQPPADT